MRKKLIDFCIWLWLALDLVFLAWVVFLLLLEM